MATNGPSYSDLYDSVQSERRTKHHGATLRAHKVLSELLKAKNEVSLAGFQHVLEKVEEREVEYSFVLFLVQRSQYRDLYVKYKKDGENFVRKAGKK